MQASGKGEKRARAGRSARGAGSRAVVGSSGGRKQGSRVSGGGEGWWRGRAALCWRKAWRRERGGGGKRERRAAMSRAKIGIKRVPLACPDGNEAQRRPQSHQNHQSDGFEPPTSPADAPPVSLVAM